MLSLQNMDEGEVREFDARVRRFMDGYSGELEYACEPKFDGLAVGLVYENGILTVAATGGNGAIGENVTQIYGRSRDPPPTRGIHILRFWTYAERSTCARQTLMP